MSKLIPAAKFEHLLVALTNTLANPKLKPWIREMGKDQATVHISIYKAAARAPLAQPEYANDLAFDLEAFKRIALEEGQSQGKA